MNPDEGFDHFDGSGTENFAAALILLCLDEDPAFRIAFANLIGNLAGLTPLEMPSEWGREAGLHVDSDSKRRSDLWLRFPRITVLVEVKTHSRWHPADVGKQLTEQRDARLRRDNSTCTAVLLAPRLLLRHLQRLNLCHFPTISWREFLDVVDLLESKCRVTNMAHEHWSRNVEKDYGLAQGDPGSPFVAVASQTACLVAFLRAALRHLDGEPRRHAVWFSSPDGRPRQRRQWAWVGIAVPGNVPQVGRAYVGIYTYTAAPPGESLGTFLEAYRFGDQDNSLVSIPFAPRDLSAEALDETLGEFLRAFHESRS